MLFNKAVKELEFVVVNIYSCWNSRNQIFIFSIDTASSNGCILCLINSIAGNHIPLQILSQSISNKIYTC